MAHDSKRPMVLRLGGPNAAVAARRPAGRKPPGHSPPPHPMFLKAPAKMTPGELALYVAMMTGK